jgi:hypothetical protein
MTLNIVTIYVIILCFFNIKLGKPIHRILHSKMRLSAYAERGTGVLAGFLMLFPLRLVVPEHMSLIVVSYGLVGGLWCIIYYDYIAKKEDDD